MADADRSIDLRGVPCPLNWVRAKLRLEAMAPGQVLEILIDDGDPVRSVPHLVKADGHRILEAASRERYVVLQVERAG